jgi:hypothetical protein
VVPETDAGLVENFLDTDAREIEIEIGRLNKGFFDYIQREKKKEANTDEPIYL